MKRISTALLAFLLALSLSVAGWAETPEICETSVIPEDLEIQEPMENQEDQESSALPEASENQEIPDNPVNPETSEEQKKTETPVNSENQENNESEDSSETTESSELKKTQAVQERPVMTEEPENKESKKNPKLQNSPMQPETQIPKESLDLHTVPIEHPVLGKEECEEYAFFFREDAGLNNAVIAGILANMQSESDFNPTNIGDNGKAFGLCQWNELRQKRLDKLCERMELNRDDIKTQQVFMIAELQVYFKDTWNILQWIEETEDGAAEAAWYLCKDYEKPAGLEEELLTREQLAREYFHLLTE